MAYTNRTIKLAFDGTDEKYPNLGDDIWVLITNPMLVPASMLDSGTDIQLDANNNPVDRNAAVVSAQKTMASLVVDWSIYDPTDMAEEPQVLPLPATVETIQRIPLVIANAIGEIINKALNPQ